MPLPSAKACSGRCSGGACRGTTPRVWVVAACEGMISLFEKRAEGLMPLASSEPAVFPSLEQFQRSMDAAEHAHAFDQLVIVGSSSDIAWIHASLPPPATRHIAAEIEYPLLPAWFKQPPALPGLTQALQGVLMS